MSGTEGGDQGHARQDRANLVEVTFLRVAVTGCLFSPSVPPCPIPVGAVVRERGLGGALFSFGGCDAHDGGCTHQDNANERLLASIACAKAKSVLKELRTTIPR